MGEGSTDGDDDGSYSQNGEGIPTLRYSATPTKNSTIVMPTRTMAQEPSPKTPMYSSWDTRISIAVDPVALITTECITVTSAMRKHARWAHSSVSAILGSGPSMARDISRLPKPGDKNLAAAQRQLGKPPNGAVGEDDTLASRWGLRGKKGKSMQDNPLLSAFARLRNDLRGCIGVSLVGGTSYGLLISCRYQKLRHSRFTPSFPSSHPILVDLRSYYFSCHCRDN